ncbi:FAD-binding oxidoreductase [Erysipelothrix urinaevulpis]|uniref:FAD-binding oxidoreductase n=1 Tax=Erysipelothrix urinaevulpis TaxID=2683717 RepID=UPI001357B74B|nr:FAD-binding oxidoreductase [Erysipelothrix urinaevulpis]
MTIETLNIKYFTGNDIPKHYIEDEFLGKSEGAHAVFVPKNHEEVVSAVNYANEHDLNIIARGSGTGLSAATFPNLNTIILDMTAMNRIIDLNPKTMTLTVEPGVELQTIQEYVEKHHFFYPPDPGSKNSSIGGNIATNAGGMRALKYGVTRDYVRALTVVLANGETLELGSENVKSSSGYDLKHLFIGSEGTLGITTQIKLKLIPLPQYSESLILAFDDLHTASTNVNKIIKAGLSPSALEFFERDMLQMSMDETKIPFVTDKGQAFLLVTIDGTSTEFIQEEVKKLRDVVGKDADDFVELDEIQNRNVWKLRDNLLQAVVNYTEQVTLDETVPVHLIAKLYDYTKELEHEYGVSIMSFGHAGDGNLHTCVLRGDLSQTEWDTKRDDVLTLLYAKIKEYEGLPSAEHGIGLIKKKYFYQMMDPTYIKYLQRVKLAFDPENRLNPGKVFDIE